MKKISMIIVAVIMSFVLVGCGETVTEVRQYSVEYLDYDGTILQSENYAVDDDLSGVTAPADPDRTGYSFDGWSGTIPQTMGEKSVTLIAMYSINQYIVEFVDYDGTVIRTEEHIFGADLSGVTAPVDPVRTGYTFENWAGTIPDTMGVEKITLTATYKVNQQTIDFIDYDGSVLQTVAYDFGADLSAVTNPIDPTREGYTFDSWIGTIPTTMGEETVTLTASYTLNHYTISYELDGGSNAGTNVFAYTIEDRTITVRAASKTEAVFVGWYDNADFTGSAITEIPTGTYGNIVLYAKWEMNEYRVEYVDFDGIVLQTEDYEYGASLIDVTAPVDPERAGYTFNGWSGTLPETMESSNVTITATYSLNTYSIRYHLDGGSNHMSNKKTYNIENKTITLLDPKKSGSEFLGWYASSDFSGDVVTEIISGTYGYISLYAKWELKDYTVEYVDYDGTGLQVTVYEYGADLSGVIAPADPVREGYTFSGWNGTVPATMGTNAIIITATYTINQYTVSYDLDGGTNNEYNAFIYNIEDNTLSLLAPTKDEATFIGWYDTSDFSGDVVTEITTGSFGDKTYYAKWEMNEYQVINVRVDSSYDSSDPFNLAVGETIVEVSLGGNHSSALTSNGRVFTWGHNGDGELGASTGGNQIIPKEITSSFNLAIGETITSVSLGYSFSSAVTSDGRVFTWGDNSNGQLGDGTTADKLYPTDITSQFNLQVGETISSVTLGKMHAIAVTSENRIFTWGDNGYGQLGDETTTDKHEPTDITSQFSLIQGEVIIEVSLGSSHSSAITSEGRIFTWGSNSNGKLGNGTSENSSKPIDITSQFNLAVGEKVASVSLGYASSLVITSEGRVFSWGYNEDGELGDGTTLSKFVPTEITNQFNLAIGETITSISSGAYHSSAVTSENRLFTWGNNSSAKLGDGTSTHRTVPTDITARFNLIIGEAITSTSFGYDHSSSITSDGSLFMWGYNGYFQLGEEPAYGVFTYEILDITYYFNYFDAYEEILNDFDIDLTYEFISYEGYTFVDWYTDSDLSHPYNGTLMPNYPLYALYIED